MSGMLLVIHAVHFTPRDRPRNNPPPAARTHSPIATAVAIFRHGNSRINREQSLGPFWAQSTSPSSRPLPLLLPLPNMLLRDTERELLALIVPAPRRDKPDTPKARIAEYFLWNYYKIRSYGVIMPGKKFCSPGGNGSNMKVHTLP